MHTRFAPVRDCFHDLLAAGRETGASLTVWYDGHPVIDLVGGSRTSAGASDGTDPERGFAFAYATARLAEHDRVDELVEALHSCL
ncbi:hypothetical protein [Micromonospora sp. NBC_01638]|uniref:hypothetical protein n=1 Tax=Micromonospora sp. NBC_01638 TaxID=2975982 RepID=UPI0038631AD4|nr:hypothetical protein OG811_11735 [Micromonospora sp. NBC_01638]